LIEPDCLQKHSSSCKVVSRRHRPVGLFTTVSFANGDLEDRD
jgi:hypothetical protein